MSQHRKSRETTASHELSDFSDTAFAMALLWVIPVMAFLYALTRL